MSEGGEDCGIWGYHQKVCGVRGCHGFDEAPEVEVQVEEAECSLVAICNSRSFLLSEPCFCGGCAPLIILSNLNAILLFYQCMVGLIFLLLDCN